MAFDAYRTPTIDELARILGIKPKVLEADIRDMAWLWEESIRQMDLSNPLGALDVVNAIAKAYIRGRNCRMGSYQAIRKHFPTKAAVMYHLARYVSEENNKGGFAIFPKLRDAGVTSTDSFLSIAGRMSTERWQMQEEQRRREREEAKKEGQQKARDFMENLRKEIEGRYDILDEIRRFVDNDQQ